jgi:hypothetical protein
LPSTFLGKLLNDLKSLLSVAILLARSVASFLQHVDLTGLFCGKLPGCIKSLLQRVDLIGALYRELLGYIKSLLQQIDFICPLYGELLS